MQFYGKAEAVATRIIDAFQRGDVPTALAQVFIRRKDDVTTFQFSNRFEEVNRFRTTL